MSMRIVFMGTPAFAVPTLDLLVREGYQVVGVVTAADKIGGRGHKQLIESPVKQYAVAHDLRVLQPLKLKDPAFLEELQQLKADLQVVVAFRMLPEAVWRMPPMGTFNLHASLLPKYRGAAPINWAIIRGEKETGVTTFFIQQDIDTGDLLFQERTPIGDNESAGELHDRLMILGAEVALKTVKAIESGEYQPRRQDDSQATTAPKLFHETCEINFNQPALAVHNFVRGLSPYPAAWTTFNGLEMKILRAAFDPTPPHEPAGTPVSDHKKSLRFAAVDGYLQVLELQLQGKKRMPVSDFLNGYKW